MRELGARFDFGDDLVGVLALELRESGMQCRCGRVARRGKMPTCLLEGFIWDGHDCGWCCGEQKVKGVVKGWMEVRDGGAELGRRVLVGGEAGGEGPTMRLAWRRRELEGISCG